MNAIWEWIFIKLSEKTTWAAIITTVVTAIGVSLKPELQDAIIQVALAVTTAILVIYKEKKGK